MLLREWQRLNDQQGVVMAIWAIALIPLILLCGLAIDGTNVIMQQRKLQSAVDLALEAAGRTVLDPQNIPVQVHNLFTANTAGMAGVSAPTITVDNAKRQLTVTASVTVPTFFMKLKNITATTHTVSGTMSLAIKQEIAIAVDASKTSISSGFLKTVLHPLVSFVYKCPPSYLFSVVPLSTEIALSENNTVQTNLVNHLSTTTNDETAAVAFCPLSKRVAWNRQALATVSNLFYGTTLSQQTSYSAPNVRCPSGHPACPNVLYPGRCHRGSQSCSAPYKYFISTTFPISPLSANRSLTAHYLEELAALTDTSNGLWLSLIVWAWRTIAPEWNDFFATNSNIDTLTRTTGSYPQPYGNSIKSIILIVAGDSYWDEGSVNAMKCFSYAQCGFYGNKRTEKCPSGCKHCFNMHTWKTTLYGIVPLTNDFTKTVVDDTCENHNYQTIDQMLGLNVGETNNCQVSIDAATYQRTVVKGVNDKFTRVCQNIKAAGINIFVVTGKSVAYTVTDCATNSNYVYSTDGSTAQITEALQSISNQLQILSTNTHEGGR